MATLKVTFNRVYFKDPKCRAYSFSATVYVSTIDDENPRHVALQSAAQDITDLNNMHVVDLSQPPWSTKFDNLSGDITIKIRFTPTGCAAAAYTPLPIHLGPLPTCDTAWERARPDWHFISETSDYFLDWSVTVEGGAADAQLPDHVDASRLHARHQGRSTISGTGTHPIVEFDPIVPVPEIGLLKGPILSKTKRRMRSKLTRGVIWNSDLKYPIRVDDMSPLNVFPNPAAIPVLDPNDGLVSRRPRNDTCARIQFTRYAPSSMRFGDDDQRLKWDYVSLDEQGAVQFFGDDNKDRGLKVKVYGTNEGEVELRVRYCPGDGGQERYVGWYRALVKRIRKIPYRVNILEGPNRSDKPRCDADDILAHIKIANTFLRQMAVELTADADQDDRITVEQRMGLGGPSARSLRPGIFRVRGLPRGYTCNVDALGNKPPCMFLNYRPNVLNIVYVKSINPCLGWKEWVPGQAVSWKQNGAGEFVYDAPRGASLAWGLAYGRPYGAKPQVQKMFLAGGNVLAAHPDCFALFLSDKMGNPTKTGGIGPLGRGGRYRYGVTLAHEVGHILNLEHRLDRSREQKRKGTIFPDGLKYPRLENIMYYNAWSMSQDFDIIQAKAVHQSPLGHY